VWLDHPAVRVVRSVQSVIIIKVSAQIGNYVRLQKIVGVASKFVNLIQV